MATNLEFRTVKSSLQGLRFSRTRQMRLACAAEKANQPANLEEVRSLLRSQKQDALALYGPEALPADLVHIFASTEEANREMFDFSAVPFLTELKAYSRGLGLATTLWAESPTGQGRPLQACNFLLADVKQAAATVMTVCNFHSWGSERLLREVLGPDYDTFQGRLIFAAINDPTLALGPLTLSIFIAHEVACIKLVEQAKNVGLATKDLSAEEEAFFTYAYTYAFIACLLRAVGKKALFSPTDGGDLKKTVKVFSQSYINSMEAWQVMPKAVRKRYAIASDCQQGMKFPYPFQVELVNPQQSFFMDSKVVGLDPSRKQ